VNVFRKLHLRRLSRGFRFRLTAAYALFFTFLLLGVAVLFRERLDNILQEQEKAAVNDLWAAMKGYLRIEKKHEIDPDERALWYYDEEDPEETRIVLEIKKISMIADATGKPILDDNDQPAVSTEYKDSLGVDPPEQIRATINAAKGLKNPPAVWSTRWSSDGERYLVHAGLVWDEKHQHPFYVALGVPLSQYGAILRGFTWIFVAVIPGALILGTLLGWVMAGRALKPVLEVAQTAQRISGSNLSLRIPTRQSGDELDYLVITFNRMIERLEASFQQMKQFSADVSHELRTPITAIRGQLEVALFTAKTTDQYREAIFNALQDVDRLSQIVRALLLLSQAESGQVILQKQRLNLSDLVTDLVEQFQIPAEEAKITLTADLPAECFADVDRVQIERLITNLLSNALKFTAKGGKVRVALQSLPAHTELVIEDNGRGIAPEYLPHIFDRFYRVPGSGTAPGPDQGLGLGLSFVAWIAKAHNGKIDVDSTPGQGTKFTINLPACGADSDKLELSVPSSTPAIGAVS